MTRNQAAEKLMQELQKGIDSGEKFGWISEEEAAQLLAIDEDEADRKILDAAMTAYQADPLTYSFDGVRRLLDLESAN